MKTVVVLVMHGTPPKDFPSNERAEFFGLHMRLDYGSAGPERAALQRRHDALEAKMRAWPRSAENDPFYAASQALAESLSFESGYEVVLGFNEFCAPSVDEALEKAAARSPNQVAVVSPMLTPGGEHAEIEIPAAIKAAQKRYPDITFRYAWPFDVSDVAALLNAQIHQFIKG